MTIRVFIDGNVWNFLFDKNLDLAVELPSSEFSIHHTREAEFEIPEHKPELSSFIHATMERCQIRTDVFFGFGDSSKPADEQRYGGFGVGRFADIAEVEFISKHRASQTSRPTKLRKHEADISLAARALHSVVLTLDRNSVALKHASAQGGKVVYLNEYEDSKLSLADFIKAKI